MNEVENGKAKWYKNTKHYKDHTRMQTCNFERQNGNKKRILKIPSLQ
jgi:hypothetical protein